jgi:hypothetical protein
MSVVVDDHSGVDVGGESAHFRTFLLVRPLLFTVSTEPLVRCVPVSSGV